MRRWRPTTIPPRAVINIAHGMGEHSIRYGWLAEKFAAEGIEVWAADQRGHGMTADTGVNDPGKGGLPGHCHDGDTFERVTDDVHRINMAIRGAHPGVPLILLGHSWGSFISQNYIGRTGGGDIDGCVLSGTRGPGGLKVRAGIPFLSLLAALKGGRNGSPLARALVDGPCNRAFRPNRTDFDWLSRDESAVDAYRADPLCGRLCSAGFYRDLARGLNRIHGRQHIAGIRADLPVYIVCGSADPVGDMGASPTALVNAYRSRGMGDLEFVLYPGARHEPLNETNREEVAANLLSWIQRHTSRRDTGD